MIPQIRISQNVVAPAAVTYYAKGFNENWVKQNQCMLGKKKKQWSCFLFLKFSNMMISVRKCCFSLIHFFTYCFAFHSFYNFCFIYFSIISMYILSRNACCLFWEHLSSKNTVLLGNFLQILNSWPTTKFKSKKISLLWTLRFMFGSVRLGCCFFLSPFIVIVLLSMRAFYNCVVMNEFTDCCVNCEKMLWMAWRRNVKRTPQL